MYSSGLHCFTVLLNPALSCELSTLANALVKRKARQTMMEPLISVISGKRANGRAAKPQLGLGEGCDAWQEWAKGVIHLPLLAVITWRDSSS